MPRTVSTNPPVYLTTLAVACLLLAVAVISRSSGVESTSAFRPHVPGELLIKFRPEALETDRLAVRDQLAVEVMHTFQGGAQRWRLAPGVTVEDALASLEGNEDVEYAEPNAIMTLSAPRVPLDLYYDPNQWAPQKIEAEDA